jgi:hypothetical protein
MQMNLSATRPIIAGLFLLALLCNTDAKASKISDSLTVQLKAISAEMSDHGKNEFILAEALSDGLLKDNEAYVFQYNPGHVIINNKELPGPLLSRYALLMKNFFATVNKEKAAKISTSISMTGVIHLNEVLDPKSAFRKYAPDINKKEEQFLAPRPGATMHYDAIIKEMAREGLADTTKELQVMFSVKGVFVNQKALPAEAQKKYFAWFVKEAGFTPVKGEDGVTIIHNKD